MAFNEVNPLHSICVGGPLDGKTALRDRYVLCAYVDRPQPVSLLRDADTVCIASLALVIYTLRKYYIGGRRRWAFVLEDESAEVAITLLIVSECRKMDSRDVKSPRSSPPAS